MAGPLSGHRIIEIAGIGPGPFAAMLLSDMGAEVIRVDRAAAAPPLGVPRGEDTGRNVDVLMRGRRSIALDFKHPDGIAALKTLVAGSDAILEGFRPGVMERLGIGPDVLMAENPRLVFGRMTGWGQDGPYAQAAGHDINYIALAGSLAHIGRTDQPPTPPLNLLGDFGGGGMFLAFGVVCALLEAKQSGQGQVVDTAMVDGTAVLMSMFHGFRAMGIHDFERRGANTLDSGAHFYDVYACADGAYISLGSIEPQFYAELLRITGLAAEPAFAAQHDKSQWPALKARLAEVFATKSRDEWCSLLEHTDACFAPVLTIDEAARHPHNVHRGTFIEPGGILQAAPAPRFSRTSPGTPKQPANPGEHTREVLLEAGFTAEQVDALQASGAAR